MKYNKRKESDKKLPDSISCSQQNYGTIPYQIQSLFANLVELDKLGKITDEIVQNIRKDSDYQSYHGYVPNRVRKSIL